MKFPLRILPKLNAVRHLYTPEDESRQAELIAADPLDARSDRVLPGFFLPATTSTSLPAATSSSIPPPPPPPAPMSTPPPPPPPPPPTITITAISTSISTSLLTTTQNVTVNRTSYITDTATFTTTYIPAPSHNTIAPVPATQPPSAHAVSASAVLAIVSGVINILLLVAMFFAVRRFYRMYRAERVLRKQLQTEGVELRWPEGKGGGEGWAEG